MATVRHFFGLVGILGMCACTSSGNDSSDDTGGGGGNARTNTDNTSSPPAFGGNANATAATDTNNPQPSRGGAFTSNTQVYSVGGAQLTATTPQVNPNRNITDAELTTLEDNACTGWTVEPEASAAAKLELVIDVSSSMSNRAPGSNRTKWEETRDALIDAVPGPASGGGLPDAVSIGLMFYPNMVNETVSKTPVPVDTCLNTAAEVKMASLSANRDAVRSSIQSIVLGRGTPTTDAYNYVLNNTVLSPEQTAIAGDPYMLLITDGMPTLYEGCWNPKGTLTNLEGDPVVAAVDAAYNNGVKTFVVGSPGSEDGRAWLSMAAFMGGTARGDCDPYNASGPYCHMDMTAAANFSEALRAGLAGVIEQIFTCKFQIPTIAANGETVDPNRASPVIRYSNGINTLLGKNTSTGTSCDYGYRLVGTNQLEFCSKSCRELQSDSHAVVEVMFTCTDAATSP